MAQVTPAGQLSNARSTSDMFLPSGAAVDVGSVLEIALWSVSTPCILLDAAID